MYKIKYANNQGVYFFTCQSAVVVTASEFANKYNQPVDNADMVAVFSGMEAIPANMPIQSIGEDYMVVLTNADELLIDGESIELSDQVDSFDCSD